MTYELIQSVQKLLADAKALIETNNTPHNLPTIQQAIVQLELSQELDELQKMIESPDTFAEAFKERCKFRETDKEQTISFSELPQSTTNKLYWDIANLLFKPKTMQDMLAIILPKCQYQITPSYPEHLENRKALKQLTPSLSRTGLNSTKNEEPKLELFKHYVFDKDVLIDTRDFERLPLKHHALLQQQLTKDYPSLATKLYAHNSTWSTLAADINILNIKGASPKTAIEQLIKGLTLGGEKITGQQNAGVSATEAVVRFFTYLELLPTQTKSSVLALKYNDNKTLNNILEDEIKQGKCIETSTTHLKALLDNHSKETILTTPPAMSEDDLKNLERQYQVKGLGGRSILRSEKEDGSSLHLPNTLTQKALEKITPENQEDLVNLLISLPSSFYSVLFQHITLNKIKDILKALAKTIKEGFFNPEQVEALSYAICENYTRLNPNTGPLFWAIDTESPLIRNEVIKRLKNKTEQDQLAAVKEKNFFDQAVLHIAAIHPESLKAVINLYPEKDLLTAVKEKDSYRNTVLHYAANHPESLKILLNLLPEKDLFAAVTEIGMNRHTVLHMVIDHPESLRAILELLPKQNRLDAIKIEDTSGQAVLNRVADHPESLRAILELLPEESRLDAIKENFVKETALHKSAKHPESLKAILELLPERDRLDAVSKGNYSGNTVLHYAANHPKSLKILLSLLPEKDLPTALNTRGKDNRTVRDIASDSESQNLIKMIDASSNLQSSNKPLFFSQTRTEQIHDDMEEQVKQIESEFGKPK